MNKNIPQELYNHSKYDFHKKRKVQNPKNQKRKYIKQKKPKNKEREKENTPNEIFEENNEINKLLNKHQEKKEKEKIDKNYKKEQQDNKDISKLKNDEMRYFGKNINNLSSLEQRINQYIINGSNFKKLFTNNNLVMNYNSIILPKNNSEIDEIFELLSIKYVSNPQYVIEYRKDIFLTLLREEKNNIPDYTLIKNIIAPETRLKYILFLIQVCDKITNKEEIHYLSINIFDRVLIKYYQMNKIINEKILQLICFTALFIAYKYETGFYFLIDDLINHTEDSLVTKEQVLKFEYEINSLLDFEYLVVYPSDFLKHYELIDSISNKKIYYFCLYLIDFIISDINLMSYKKSLITASCYYIAKANLINVNNWSNVFQFVTGYRKDEVKDLAIKIIKEMKDSKNSVIFKCLKKKYSREEYYNVSDDIIKKK
jgi:hypothetical protein